MQISFACSYVRFQNKAYNGLFLCWAPESIELTMRTCSPPGTNGVVTNFEVRTFDGCANPPLGFSFFNSFRARWFAEQFKNSRASWYVR